MGDGLTGDMFGGALKGDTPVDSEDWYTAKDIKSWVEATDPDKVAAAGKDYKDFKDKFSGESGDDLLGFLQKVGRELDAAWGGPKSSAYVCQVQLSMLYSSAKELIDSADMLATALKTHGEDDGDGSLKSLRKYFQQDDSKFLGFIPTGSGTSQFQADVIKASGGDALYVDPDHDFKYNGMTSDNAPEPGSQTDLAYRQIVDHVAQQRLKTHNATAETYNAPAGTVSQTYSSMPGWMTLQLPPGTLPPQPNPYAGDPTKPAPTDPKPDPKKPGNKGVPTNSGPPGPGSSGIPQHLPTTLSSSSPYHLSNTPSGIGNPPGVPTSSTHGGTDLSQFTDPTKSLPTGTSLNNPPSTIGNPTTNLPTTGLPTTPPTGDPITTPPTFPTTPTTSFPSGKFPSVNTGKVPGLEGSPFSSGSGSGSSSNGLIGGGAAGGKVSSGSVNEAAAANASKALQTEQAEAMGATAARNSGMMPGMMPPPMGGMGGQNNQELPSSAVLYEDEIDSPFKPDDDAGPYAGPGLIA